MKRVLCYGDSNTWGYVPGLGVRHPEDVRWTGVAAKLLGPDYRIIEEGMNGRTTAFDDPYYDFRNGKRGLGYALCAHAPLDLVVVGLGSNDLKFTDAIGSSKGLQELLRLIRNASACYPDSISEIFPNGTKILVVSPIHLHPEVDRQGPEFDFYGKYEQSCLFAKYFQPAAELYHAAFLDAAAYAAASPTDGVHMEPEGHRALGKAIAKKIQEIFS